MPRFACQVVLSAQSPDRVIICPSKYVQQADADADAGAASDAADAAGINSLTDLRNDHQSRQIDSVTSRSCKRTAASVSVDRSR
jgi:hypothetical protein